MNESQRVRILLVTRNLPPLVGGMERLNWHMAAELAKVAEVRVIGPQGCAALAPAGVAVREAPLKPLWKFLLRARALALRETRVWRPDIVLAGSGLTAPVARAAARICGARSAVYVHGLDIAVRHVVYRALWLPAIRRADRVIANSQATAGLCRDIGIDPARIGIVHPGVDLPAAEPLSPVERGRGEGTRPQMASCEPEPSSGPSGHLLPKGEGTSREPHLPLEGRTFEPLSPRERGGGEGTASRNAPASAPTLTPSFRGRSQPHRERNPESSFADRDQGESRIPGSVRAFRTRHNLGNRPLLLSVGRLSARKGLREFVTHALPRIAAAQPGVMLLIVGDAPRDAVHAEAQTPDSIRAAAAAAGVEDRVTFLGTITDYAELGDVYHAADVHIFPVREIPGDPEGFGMVAVEAAAHGLPTVAFATGGIVDAVAEGRSGHLVPSGDYEALAAGVLGTLAAREALRTSCIEFARQFAWPLFGQKVIDQLTRIVPRIATTGHPE